MLPDPAPPLTVDELAAQAGVTREIMLRRIATVLAKRPWYRRLWLRCRMWIASAKKPVSGRNG